MGRGRPGCRLQQCHRIDVVIDTWLPRRYIPAAGLDAVSYTSQLCVAVGQSGQAASTPGSTRTFIIQTDDN